MDKLNSSNEGNTAKVKSRILACFSYTTAHGYGRFATAIGESRLRKWFWLLACAAAYGVFTYQLMDLASQYLSKPLKTRASIAHEQKLEFPQVTICNLNKIRKSKLPQQIIDEFPEILNFDIGETETRNITATPSQPGQNDFPAVMNLGDLPLFVQVVEKTHQRLAEYPEAELEQLGHQLEDMILACWFNAMECLFNKQHLWIQFWHHKYGNCYTFNRGTNEHNERTEVMTSSLPGHEGGLTLDINIEQYEYIDLLSQEAGVRIFVASQNDMPFPHELGHSAPPGYATAIQLRKVVVGRLDPFHNQSCKPGKDINNDNIFRRFNVSYGDLTCKFSCLAVMMYNMCGCVMYALKYSEHHTNVCDGSDKDAVACVNSAFDKYHQGACEKGCQEKCWEDLFKTTLSLSKWPSRHFENILVRSLDEKDLKNYSTDLSDNFLRLKIYYGELNYEVIAEELAYTSARFLSDIGGIMGMWIGISALTCVEALELMASLCSMILRKFKQKRTDVIEVQPNDNSA
nr:amiloride-sensitive sodium channel subunit beta-like [Pocillopora verrucosa]